MNTRGLKEIQKALKQQYYEKTGEKADRCKVYYNNFLDKLKDDVSNYLSDTIDINADELIFTYFFDVNLIKELIDLYFEVNKIKVKDIKKLQKANNKFTLKHLDIMPYFAGNVFCAIADELAFYISRYVD